MIMVLCALTGFGNAVLDRLIAIGQAPQLVVTRAETGRFPHYPLEDITALAARHAIPVLFGAQGEAAIRAMQPDLLLCATYHRILNAETRAAARHAINLHPSLLPRYRGPNPFYWAIRRGEVETGVTAHRLEAEPDAGAICWAARLALTPEETQGSLRRRLADLAADGAEAVWRDLMAGTLTWRDQNHALAEWQDKPGPDDLRIDLSQPVDGIERQIRALLPYPGVRLADRDVAGIRTCLRPDAAGDKQQAVLSLGEKSIIIQFADDLG